MCVSAYILYIYDGELYVEDDCRVERGLAQRYVALPAVACRGPGCVCVTCGLNHSSSRHTVYYVRIGLSTKD